jgi:hypothetical protein
MSSLQASCSHRDLFITIPYTRRLIALMLRPEQIEGLDNGCSVRV